MIFNGVCTAMITPFKKDGSVDFDKFEKQIEFQIKNNISALLFLGTTGEASTLEENEKIEIIKFAVKVCNKRVKIIVGAGSNNTKKAAQNCKQYEKLGVDALLVITPYYNKCTQKGLFLHFSEIAKSTSLEIIMYNVPSRTGVNMTADTVCEIYNHNKNIVAIKEASGDINQYCEIIKKCDITLYGGDDDLFYLSLASGGKGLISVTSNLYPKHMQSIYDNFAAHDYVTSRSLQYKIDNVIKNMFIETNPMPVKFAMSVKNLDGGFTRLPLCEMQESSKEKVKIAIRQFDF